MVPEVARPTTFAPPSQATSTYNADRRVPVPRAPLSDAILAVIDETCAQIGCSPPTPDGRLFAAVNELAEVAPEDGTLAYPFVEFALQRHGIIEPSPHLVIIWGPTDDPAPLLEQLRPRLPSILASAPSTRPFTRVGVGTNARDGADGVIILALQTSHVETGPIPRVVNDDRSFLVEGRILDGYRSPQVFVTRETGEVVHVTEGRDGRFNARVSCQGRRGRQQVEITAEDAAGSTVLANFPVWCNQAPPTSVTVTPNEDDLRPPATPTEAEARMLKLVNHDRASHDLPPLSAAADVADVARAHSREMYQTGTVAHVSPTTGSAVDRVRAAKISTTVVLENVARAYGVVEAHAGLMNSPGHRANLLSPEATHIGIGIVFGDEVARRRELFVTQVFTRVTPKLSPEDAGREIRAALDARAGLSRDPKLSTLAQEYANALAAGEPAAEISKRMAPKLDQLSPRYSKVSTSVVALADIAAFDADEAVGEPSITHYGIGVISGAHEQLGEHTLFVVLLLGVAR